MKPVRIILLAMCLFMPSAAPGAAMRHGAMSRGGVPQPLPWSSAPLLKIRMNGEKRGLMVVSVVPQNIAANYIDAWSNNLKDDNGHRQLALEMGGAKLDKPASGGFQWLAAREEWGGKVRVASAVYYFGERGAKDPTAMFLQQKHELEIVPQPFPREHSRYRANEVWKFLVRFNGQPLGNQMVALETRNGSKAGFVSDAQGMIAVHLPDDFKPEDATAADGHGMRNADFVLAAEHADGGKTYLTAFNGSYGPNAFDKRSLALGLGFMLLGGVCASPLLRQRKKGQKKEEAGHA